MKPNEEALIALICSRNVQLSSKYFSQSRARDRRYKALSYCVDKTTPAALLHGAITAELNYTLCMAKPAELRELGDWWAKAVFDAHQSMKEKFTKMLRQTMVDEKFTVERMAKLEKINRPTNERVSGSKKDIKTRVADMLAAFGNMAIVEILEPAHVWWFWVIHNHCKGNAQCKQHANKIHHPAALPQIPNRDGCKCSVVPVIHQ